VEHLTILKNIHIYLVHPYYYIVPAIEAPNGTWVEVEPVEKVDVINLYELSSSIEKISEIVNSPVNVKRWDGEKKQVGAEATSFWIIHWYDNGTIRIIPHFKLPQEIDDETGELLNGGWVASQERGPSTFSSGTPFSQLAKAILLSP